MNKGDIFNNKIAVSIIGGVLLFTICGGLLITYEKERQATLNETISTQEERLAVLEIKIDELIKGAAEKTRVDIDARLANETRVKELEAKLAAESAARANLETKVASEAGLSTARINEIARGLSNEYDLPLIIADWRKKTANIRCDFSFGYSTGSGVLVKFIEEDGSTVYGVLTNKHVLTDSVGRPATSCTVRFPDYGTQVKGLNSKDEIQVSTEGYDFGRIIITGADAYLRDTAITGGRYCSTKPAIGDELIIIGYPAIGSNEDITATEGIVSGFESNYFVTSAKVERGNSGGTAVLLKNNCFLGVPTFVQSGALESLARILDVNVLNNN